MFDAWNLVGVGGGSAALTYLATNWKPSADGKTTLRLSLDKSGSLMTDVRLLGGGLAWLTSMYTKGQTRKVLQTTAAASLFSLAQTEIVRWRLGQLQSKGEFNGIATNLPIMDMKFGALPGPQQPAYGMHQPQGVWAHR